MIKFRVDDLIADYPQLFPMISVYGDWEEEELFQVRELYEATQTYKDRVDEDGIKFALKFYASNPMDEDSEMVVEYDLAPYI